VAEPTLTPTSPLARALPAGDFGATDGSPGVTFRDRRDLAAVTIQLRPERVEAARTALEAAGLALPPVGRALRCAETSMLWSALDRWLAVGPHPSAPLYRTLAEALGDTAALVDQSHGMSVVELAGPKVDALLAKGTPVDLHALSVDRTAATGIDHQPALLWRVEPERVLVTVGRSFARDTVEFLQEMALEFGYRNA
jgi:sarcosine oxidase subunit gamma